MPREIVPTPGKPGSQENPLPSARDRLLQRDPLRLAVTRKSLKAVAECLADLDEKEAGKYLATLIEDLQMLRQKDTTSLAWRQAVSGLDGPRSYGLKRIGLWPGAPAAE